MAGAAPVPVIAGREGGVVAAGAGTGNVVGKARWDEGGGGDSTPRWLYAPTRSEADGASGRRRDGDGRVGARRGGDWHGGFLRATRLETLVRTGERNAGGGLKETGR